MKQDIHPVIRAYWEKVGYKITKDSRFQHADYWEIDNRTGCTIAEHFHDPERWGYFSFNEFNSGKKAYTEQEFLRLIKLKAFL